MLMRVYPHSPQGHGRIECGRARGSVVERGLNGERVKEERQREKWG